MDNFKAFIVRNFGDFIQFLTFARTFVSVTIVIIDFVVVGEVAKIKESFGIVVVAKNTVNCTVRVDFYC